MTRGRLKLFRRRLSLGAAAKDPDAGQPCDHCGGSGVEPGQQLGMRDGEVTGRCSNCAGYGTMTAAKKTPAHPAGDSRSARADRNRKG